MPSPSHLPSHCHCSHGYLADQMLKCWVGIYSSKVSVFMQITGKHLNSTKARSRCLQFIFLDLISIEFTLGPLHIQVITLGSLGLWWRLTDIWEICPAFPEDKLTDMSREINGVEFNHSSRAGKDTVIAFRLGSEFIFFSSISSDLIWCNT